MTNIIRKLATLIGILFVAMALGCASTAKQEGTGEYVDDTVITGKVKAAIFEEPTLKSAEINVETFKGVVQLSGFVSSAAAEGKAVEVIRSYFANVGKAAPLDAVAPGLRAQLTVKLNDLLYSVNRKVTG